MLTKIDVKKLKVRCVLIFLVAIVEVKENWSGNEKDPDKSMGRKG